MKGGRGQYRTGLTILTCCVFVPLSLQQLYNTVTLSIKEHLALFSVETRPSVGISTQTPDRAAILSTLRLHYNNVVTQDLYTKIKGTNFKGKTVIP